ncbi:MAG TPA: GNAT family N-acetyltransferase [Pyrinomonadaceae bacterium]|jgi:GNAT superfamily N-acetyltransferase
MSVTFRRAVREDARTIAEFAHKLVEQHQQYNPKRFAEIADKEQMTMFYGSQTQAKDAAVLVAEFEKRVVGFAYIKYEAKNYADLLVSAAWMHDLYVEETARGQKAGKLLLEKAVEVAKQLGAEKLMLTAAFQNKRAREFFEHNGFRTTMVEMMFDLTEKECND